MGSVVVSVGERALPLIEQVRGRFAQQAGELRQFFLERIEEKEVREAQSFNSLVEASLRGDKLRDDELAWFESRLGRSDVTKSETPVRIAAVLFNQLTRFPDNRTPLGLSRNELTGVTDGTINLMSRLVEERPEVRGFLQAQLIIMATDSEKIYSYGQRETAIRAMERLATTGEEFDPTSLLEAYTALMDPSRLTGRDDEAGRLAVQIRQALAFATFRSVASLQDESDDDKINTLIGRYRETQEAAKTPDPFLANLISYATNHGDLSGASLGDEFDRIYAAYRQSAEDKN